MHLKIIQFAYLVFGISIFTSAIAFDVIQEQKLDINCFAQDEKSYLMDKSKTEFFSGLNAGDIIVAEGLKKVRPNGKIKPLNK